MSDSFAIALSKRIKNARQKAMSKAAAKRIYNARHKNVILQTPVKRPGYDAGATGVKPGTFAGTNKKANAIKGYGGKLSPRGISTYASNKVGNPTEPGVLGSGRRAPYSGFSDKRGLGTSDLPVGSRQVVTPLKVSTKFW